MHAKRCRTRRLSDIVNNRHPVAGQLRAVRPYVPVEDEPPLSPRAKHTRKGDLL